MRTTNQSTLNALLRDGARRLRDAQIESAALDARLLLCRASGLRHDKLISKSGETAGVDVTEEFERLLLRRQAGEPVARILGEKEFWGLPFALSPHTLVPRPDSECLIDAALGHVKDKTLPLRLLDLGTGSGCLLLALLSELPNATGTGVDISQGAIATATENAARLGFGHRAEFVVGNWAEGVAGIFDLVISNPPYIPSAEIEQLAPDVRDHDPRRALEGGLDGLDCYRIILEALPQLLAPGGIAVLETSPHLYADLCALAEASPQLEAIAAIADLAGRARGLTLGKPNFQC